MAYSNTYIVQNDCMKLLIYNEGYVEGYAYIDFDDEPNCKKYLWYCDENGNIYTYRKKKKSISLHRFVVHAKENDKVFFNDKDKHNCRKYNLTIINETNIENRYDNYNDYVILSIYNGQELIRQLFIDIDDVEKCKNYIWKIGAYGEPTAYTNKGVTSLSRYLMDIYNSNIWVCFHDKNKDNCRKRNLYLVNSLTKEVIEDRLNSYEFKDRYTLILTIYDEIGNKYAVLLDNIDKRITCKYQWKYDSINRIIYGFNRYNEKVLLDKLLLNSTSDNTFVYHLDNNIFNCKKNNMLLCTTTGFNNIYFNPTNQMYMLLQFNPQSNRFEYSGRFIDVDSAINYRNRLTNGNKMLKYI